MKEDTLDAFNRLQEQAMDKLNLMAPKRIEEIVSNTKSAEYKEVSGYVARIEHFCAGVNCGIYDRKIVYTLAHVYLDGFPIMKRITPIIDRKNKKGIDYYKNTHDVIKWMKRKSGECL